MQCFPPPARISVHQADFDEAATCADGPISTQDQDSYSLSTTSFEQNLKNNKLQVAIQKPECFATLKARHMAKPSVETDSHLFQSFFQTPSSHCSHCSSFESSYRESTASFLESGIDELSDSLHDPFYSVLDDANVEFDALDGLSPTSYLSATPPTRIKSRNSIFDVDHSVAPPKSSVPSGALVKRARLDTDESQLAVPLVLQKPCPPPVAPPEAEHNSWSRLTQPVRHSHSRNTSFRRHTYRRSASSVNPAYRSTPVLIKGFACLAQDFPELDVSGSGPSSYRPPHSSVLRFTMGSIKSKCFIGKCDTLESLRGREPTVDTVVTTQAPEIATQNYDMVLPSLSIALQDAAAADGADNVDDEELRVAMMTPDEMLSVSPPAVPIVLPPRRDHWKSDTNSPSCGSCGSTFWILRRRHHCRVCGDVFCRPCSSVLMRLDSHCQLNSMGYLSRVCSTCCQRQETGDGAVVTRGF